MPRIHTLSPTVVAKIAAGEVIERPVFAVKELLENAIDAQATSISIQIEESGLKKIVVTDNGLGMDKKDLIESVKPHTTSKIQDELTNIQTLGFRGEALSSIAAVSTMTVQSREKGAVSGYKITLKAGRVESIVPVGMPEGTVVTVSNLFSTVPARKKFLKSMRTEYRHILELITQYAMVYSDIRFLLVHNGRVVFDLLKVPTREMRLEKLLGPHVFSHLVPVTSDESFIELSGFIAKPQISTISTSKQYLFVNNRMVTDKIIASAVKESYGSLLESNRYPAFVLSLSLPLELVDVNVHPRKEQVSFVNSQSIFDTVKGVVTKTLLDHNLTFSHISFGGNQLRKGSTKTHAAEMLRSEVTTWSVKNPLEILKNTEVIQIHNTYLLLQTKSGMVLIDQHAAHERILFEQYNTEFKKMKNKKDTVFLSPSISLTFSPGESEAMKEYLPVFHSLGFTIAHNHDTTFMVTSVPTLFKDRDMEKLVREVLDEVQMGKKVKDLDYYSTSMIAFLSCRGAIMAGEVLTKKEAEKLIKKLEDTPNNATCPHGRPTKIDVSIQELEKMFKRS